MTPEERRWYIADLARVRTEARLSALEEAAKEMDEWVDAARNVRSSSDTIAAYRVAAVAIRALKEEK